MDSIPIGALFAILGVLIILSACFSGSETALMSINRYRLRHLAKAGHRGAIYTEKLLEKPDRLIGLILLGNNFVNILASSLATIIALRLYPSEAAIGIAAGILTLVVLIFSETAPKTLGALHPEKLAFPFAYIYWFILRVIFPIRWIVRLVNIIANAFLRVFGISEENASQHSLSREELKTVLHEAGAMIPKRHQTMLINVLELERICVEDIMIPRNEIIGIDLDESWDTIVEQLNRMTFTRLPVYRESIDNLVGILHLKKILKLVSQKNLSKETLEKTITETYFIPEGTPLTKQLLNFQTRKKRIGFVVDEYGDIQGLVTLEDILEEIVGEFTTDAINNTKDIRSETDGSFIVDGGVHIRDINKELHWSLPTDGPKTLNGIILEKLEMIPTPGTSLLLNNCPIEIIRTHNNAVKSVRIVPAKQKSDSTD